MNSPARRVFIAVALGLLCACSEDLPDKPLAAKTSPTGTPSAAPRDLTAQQVLLVHSYHPEYPWVASITRGVEAALLGTGLHLEVLYMDTKRHTDEAWKAEAGRRVTARLAELRPALVLACDDDAQQYFAKNLVGTAVPVVFTGVDADPTKYGYPAANVTGVIERPHLRASIALARKLRPMQKVAVLSCNDSTSTVALGFMKQENLDVEVTEYVMVDDFDGWKAAVQRFNGTVDGLVIRSYQAVKVPGGTDNVAPKEVVDWTIANATIPTIAFHDFEVADGILVGVVKSGEEYGQVAMEYGLRILRGAAPASLPILRTRQGIPMINGRTARQLGIDLTDKSLDGVTIVGGS